MKTPTISCTKADLIIRVPLGYLRHTANLNIDENYRVTSQALLGKEVVSKLEEEQEDGTTLVHEMLDRAIRSIAENESDSIVERKTPVV